MMDHLTRFMLLIAVPSNHRPIHGYFGTLEIIHPDQGTAFENKAINQLQHIPGFKKARATPYRPQGNSVSERVHSTMHAMLAIHTSVDQDNWEFLLPLVQMA